MGNACILPSSRGPTKLIFWGGNIAYLKEKHLAGELLFQYPDHLVCHADSFFIGHPLPVLSISDELRSHETYFIIPIDCFRCQTLTAASLAVLASSNKGSPINFSKCVFEYVKGENGRMLIKVPPELLMRVFVGDSRKSDTDDFENDSLCSTPELRRHYEQLVGPRDRPWSPKLETISESKIRFSPVKLLGLERKL
ncbi:uncharacterized protein LOC120274022 [Dioscorea cayenensis subsp. rotundata]|uniref:Uncharacterized protein LOC120274022 n=1 Tax=Dioscorea cayennensis subsp. rotundata TaxID=55577 RepID=A0AB40CD76_DIOCR|nr:uncharacterized protein LOC120274022 [Dioscorea cayenensis subsp. rotundata]